MTDSVQWDEVLTPILEELYRLEAGLAAMRGECLRLAEDMYPAVPSFNWEPRSRSTHGEKRYLRLEFPAGTELGLESDRCRVYVGCKKDKIADAKRKTSNRRRWEDLDKEIVRLERYLQMTRGDLRRVAASVERRRLPEGLVTGLPPGGAGFVTKGELILTGAPQVEYDLDMKVEVLDE